MDIAMPRLDGYQAAKRIRQQPWGKHMILIALTGWGQQQDRRRTQEAGFDAHLTKPVNYDAIMTLLTNLTNSASVAASQSLPH
jgi:CheY-like chemotaxis protein